MFASVGSWTPKLTTITAGQMTAINANMQLAHDAIGGGAYTPITITEWTGTVGAKYNFSATGLQIGGLGGLHILSGSTGYVDSGGFLTVSSGGTATITGALTTSGSGSITVASGGTITSAAGSTTTLAGTTTLSGAVTVNATGTLTTNSASTTTLNGPLTAAGVVSLTMTQPASTTDNGANKLYSTNTVKAWAKISTTGAGAVAVDDGFNIASVSIDATDITVTFAHAFANANYSATVGAASIGVVANAFNPSTTTIKIRQYDAVLAAVVNPQTNATLVSLQVMGRQ